MKKGSGRAQKDRDKPILPPPARSGSEHNAPQKPNPEGPPFYPEQPRKPFKSNNDKV